MAQGENGPGQSAQGGGKVMLNSGTKPVISSLVLTEAMLPANCL